MSRHRWDLFFWMGFPVILGLLWINQNTKHLSTELLAYGVIITWILYSVRSLSKRAPSNTLLSTYARIQVSLYFAVLVTLGLTIVARVGGWGYLVALGVWLSVHLVARRFNTWISSNKTKEASTNNQQHPQF